MRISQARRLLLIPIVGFCACTQSQSANPASPSVSLSSSQQVGQASAATPASAVVTFGRPDTGSPFPPPSGHDQSVHAKDNLTPRTVVIDAGGSVTFEVPPNVHQLAIYDNGKDAADVDLSVLAAAPAPCPPVPLIDDPVQRLTVQTRPCFTPWSYTHSFSTPGKYLVICTFVPHFEVGMYGCVIVRDRD